MNKASIFLPCLMCIWLALSGQNRPDPAFLEPEPSFEDAAEALIGPDKAIRDAVMLNEAILDLVDVKLQDETLVRKFERHQIFGGGFIKLLGFRWLRISTEKQKFVGTLRDDLRIPGDPFITEADLNWNLVPHRKKYIDLVYSGYKRQKEIGRQKKKRNYDEEPYLYPSEGSDLYPYKLHCEHTPSYHYRFMLDALFVPCIRPNNLEQHQNFGELHPSVGMYGPFVSDCNHSCHPEIHPYEWLWWLNLNPNRENQTHSKEWLVGLLKEGSNRFPKWSPSPRVGYIGIPFNIPPQVDTLFMEVQPLVFDCLSETKLSDWEAIPDDALDMDKPIYSWTMENGQTVILRCSAPQIQGGWKCWMEDDPRLPDGGKLYFGIATDKIFTFRLTQLW